MGGDGDTDSVYAQHDPGRAQMIWRGHAGACSHRSEHRPDDTRAESDELLKSHNKMNDWDGKGSYIGCNCRSGGPSAPWLSSLFLGLLALGVRRRRS